MEVVRSCNGIGGIGVELQWNCNGIAIKLQCNCNGAAKELQGIAIELQRNSHGTDGTAP